MIQINSHDYIFPSLEEKVAWMQAGQGTRQTFQTGDGLKRIAARMQQSDDNLSQGMRRHLGQSWQGRAASAAGDSLGRTAAALTATAGGADHGGGSTHGYGSSFDQVKRVIGTDLPKPIGKEGFFDWAQDHLGITSDYRTRLTAYRAANKAATDALEQHEASARQTLAGFQEAVQATVTPPGGAGPSQGRRAGQVGGPVQGGPGSGRPAGVGASSGPHSTGTGGAHSTRTGSAATHAPGTGSAAPAAAGSQATGTHAAGSGGVGPPRGTPDGWTPLSPPGSAPVGSPGSAGVGGIPVSNYPGPLDGPTGIRPPGSEVGGSGARPLGRWLGGQQSPTRSGWAGEPQPPLAPRTGTGGPGTAGEGGRWPGGAGAGAGVGRSGINGMSPMGMGAGGGGRERQHRNQSYQPSDEPFRIELDDFVDEAGNAVAPPVIGMPVPNAAPRLEPWERW